MLLLFILSILLLLIVAIGFYLSNIVIYPKTLSREETYHLEIEAARINKTLFENLYKEEITIKSPYGYSLHGLYFPTKEAKNTIILCHGITYTLFGCVKYMDLYLKRGFNILLYDHRNHGKSGGNTTTYGFYEKYDLKAWTDWIFQKHNHQCKIGIHGESMGAAIALQHAEIDARASFYVADCPYDTLFDILKYRLKKEYHLPSFPFLQIANFFYKLKTKSSFYDVSPRSALKKVVTPIFFIHGLEDSYIPSSMTVTMYNIKKGAKKLYLAPNAGHVKAYWHNRQEYNTLLGEFLKEIDF
ncbi:alpha/beta hydrolase [Clostridium formicaceticum]|uniref:Alpha/beta hydrolase n=1 Tax=Clostridium formicaceticum TaxID=1497 RepID=A0AAC9WGA4_9CLOT|nr:alpha/beta hydrolase [Clostridium formicaceticum]AOY78318.1 alpha/beta hydrolase [Clostridium formicaceticum]ARE86520.1 Alpha/beta hydrolase family protein [Clostridium formicaceticum]